MKQSIIESQAFLATLQSRIKDAARRKGIWQNAPGPEDEEADSNPG